MYGCTVIIDMLNLCSMLCWCCSVLTTLKVFMKDDACAYPDLVIQILQRNADRMKVQLESNFLTSVSL